MAVNKVQFQNYISQWVDEVQQMVQALETWADNKVDSNPNFDFTTAKADLETAKGNLVSSTETVQAL